MSVVKWNYKITNLQIADATITDEEISTTAAIQETKVALVHTTTDLYNNSVRTDVDKAIANGVTLTFPSTGFRIIDSVNGYTYRCTLQNGVLTTVPE